MVLLRPDEKWHLTSELSLSCEISDYGRKSAIMESSVVDGSAGGWNLINGRLMGVSQVRQRVIQMEKWSRMIFADWQDCILDVLKALSVLLGKMASGLRTAESESIETCHYCFGGDHIIAIVAYYLQIIGLHWLLVENSCVSC